MVTKIKIKRVESLTPECPNCACQTIMVSTDRMYYLECGGCGVLGYRYDDPDLAIRDFPNHHSIPKRRRG